MAQEKTSKKKTNKVSDAKRHGIQALWAFLTNSHVSGFVTGKIYTGKLKNVCVPGLNCYSCPGAVGACPIGSLQAVVGSWNFKMAYYVIGFLIFIGAIFGRLICGFLCPFGLIQDLLNKIPFPKKIRTFKGDKLLRKLKYVIFAVFVILLPMFLVDIMGQGAPYFCKLICPAGTLEGGIPLALLNKSMRSALGALYVWKCKRYTSLAFCRTDETCKNMVHLSHHHKNIGSKITNTANLGLQSNLSPTKVRIFLKWDFPTDPVPVQMDIKPQMIFKNGSIKIKNQ